MADIPTSVQLDSLDRLEARGWAPEAAASVEIEALASAARALSGLTGDNDGLDRDATWQKIQNGMRANPRLAAGRPRPWRPSPRWIRLPAFPDLGTAMPRAVAAGILAVAISLSVVLLIGNTASADFLASVAQLEQASTEALADGELSRTELARIDTRIAAVVAAVDADRDVLPAIDIDRVEAALATVDRVGLRLQAAVDTQLALIGPGRARDDASADDLRRFASGAVVSLADASVSVERALGRSPTDVGPEPTDRPAADVAPSDRETVPPERDAVVDEPTDERTRDGALAVDEDNAPTVDLKPVDETDVVRPDASTESDPPQTDQALEPVAVSPVEVEPVRPAVEREPDALAPDSLDATTDGCDAATRDDARLSEFCKLR